MLKKFFNHIGSKNKSGRENNAKPAPNSEWVPQTATVSPEELCGIDPSTMSREAIKKTLAILYKRHNNAVSSLNPELREEARMMLEAIVECREKYVETS